MTSQLDIQISDEQALRAWKLHVQGFTYREIGEQINCSYTSVWRYIQKTLKALAEQTAAIGKDYVETELERLDKMLQIYTVKAEEGDQGAATIVLRIQERRSKYLGLDAPDKKEITGSINISSALEKALKRTTEEPEDA